MFVFTLVFLVALASSQQLELAQYNALRSIWAGLGCAGAAQCPNFAASEACPANATASLGCANGVVVKLELTRLAGSINGPALAVLTGLTELDLNHHQLTTIPAQIAALTALTQLDLANSSLTGTVPAALGNLSKLAQILLQNNQLTGVLPALDKLTKLSWLLTFNNSGLGGNLPAMPASMQRLWLQNCSFTALPPNVGTLPMLNSFRVEQNRLVGDVPTFAPSVTTCVLQRNGTSATETNCLTCPATRGACECTPNPAAAACAFATTTAEPTQAAAPATPAPVTPAPAEPTTSSTGQVFMLTNATKNTNSAASLYLCSGAALLLSALVVTL
jgi:hypothetical protein